MKKIIFVFLLIGLISGAASAQKPWSQWDKKEVDKMLNGSPWGQTQTETDTREMTFSPTSDPTSVSSTSNDSSRLGSGAANTALDIKYRIRMFSAKPIREALARNILLTNPNLKANQLDGFINEDYSEWIVVAVVYEATDRRMLAPVDNKFLKATSETLKNAAYLERADGKRAFVEEYAAPTKDGTGAKFFFRRLADGKALFSPNDVLRFTADFGGGTKISWRFKLSEMTYDGKLEY